MLISGAVNYAHEVILAAALIVMPAVILACGFRGVAYSASARRPVNVSKFRLVLLDASYSLHHSGQKVLLIITGG